jgi:hypothetical protein
MLEEESVGISILTLLYNGSFPSSTEFEAHANEIKKNKLNNNNFFI